MVFGKDRKKLLRKEVKTRVTPRPDRIVGDLSKGVIDVTFSRLRGVESAAVVWRESEILSQAAG